MSLPTAPTVVTKTIPSYLYFQYLDDPDLPSLIASYNALTQGYVDWFTQINLPVYTGLQGALLDWIGQGIYGLPRPSLSTTTLNGVIGQLASNYYHGATGPSSPTPNMVTALDTMQIYQTQTTYDTPDDIYKRVLTWWFFKGNGFVFTIPWLKQRIARFLYGVNGTNPSIPFTPDIGVTFNDGTTPPTCAISIANNSTNPIAIYFKAAVENGVLSLPFRFQYTVTLT